MKGFSLIEMMIALSIAAIICFMAVPSFLHHASETTDTVAQSQLLSQLHQAQEIANNKMTVVTVCLSSDGIKCASDNATMILLSVGEELITSMYVKGKGTLHLRSYPVYRNYLLVRPTIVGNSDNGTFWYCSKDNIVQWTVTVSQSGEPRVISKPTERLEC